MALAGSQPGARDPAGEPEAVVLEVGLRDVEATENLGGLLAGRAERGDAILLTGELGAGKTSLARGYVRCFFHNPVLDVPSPTYLLHFSYSVDSDGGAEPPAAAAGNTPAPKEQQFRAGRFAQIPGCKVHHLDPYRLQEGRIAGLVDFQSIFADDVSLIEWPDRLGKEIALPRDRLEVALSGIGVQSAKRSARISAFGGRWGGILRAWKSRGAGLADEIELVRASVLGNAGLRPAGGADGAGPQSLSGTAFPRRGTAARGSDEARGLVMLGIESSCDDTGAAVVTGAGRVLGECLASQAGIHEAWGGVKPDAAQLAHKNAIDATVEAALRRAGITDPSSQLSAIAVTVGPGLGLCLAVGVKKAYELAARYQKPVVRVHHMEAHAMVTRLPNEERQHEAGLDFPYLTVLVSGGHNMTVLSEDLGKHRILGSTLDDSIGEAFDKTARLLGIKRVPGGPLLEQMANAGDANSYQLPKPLANSRDDNLRNGCDFSFSGLKSAVKSLIDKECGGLREEDDSEGAALLEKRRNIAASFQRTCVHHLVERVRRAIARAEDRFALAREASPDGEGEADGAGAGGGAGPSGEGRRGGRVGTMVVAGGVAANALVRAELAQLAGQHGLRVMIPPPRLCVDNGVMVAWTGIERFMRGLWDEPPSEVGKAEFYTEVRPKWPLGVRDGSSVNIKDRISARQRQEAQKRKAATAKAVAAEECQPAPKKAKA